MGIGAQRYRVSTLPLPTHTYNNYNEQKTETPQYTVSYRWRLKLYNRKRGKISIWSPWRVSLKWFGVCNRSPGKGSSQYSDHVNLTCISVIFFMHNKLCTIRWLNCAPNGQERRPEYEHGRFMIMTSSACGTRPNELLHHWCSSCKIL